MDEIHNQNGESKREEEGQLNRCEEGHPTSEEMRPHYIKEEWPFDDEEYSPIQEDILGREKDRKRAGIGVHIEEPVNDQSRGLESGSFTDERRGYYCSHQRSGYTGKESGYRESRQDQSAKEESVPTKEETITIINDIAESIGQVSNGLMSVVVQLIKLSDKIRNL